MSPDTTAPDTTAPDTTAPDTTAATVLVTDAAAGFELDPRPADVVVFGSHLAFGSVGLNAGLPVYAEAGIRCAAIPTIILSNLPHYRSVQALDVSAEWITASLRDLTAAGALRCLRAVAVGYLAAPSQALAIAAWYRNLDPATRPPWCWIRPSATPTSASIPIPRWCPLFASRWSRSPPP